MKKNNITTVSKKYLIFLFVLSVSINSIAQKESRIKIDSGNGNKITIRQQGKDSSLKSELDIIHSDTNTINLDQNDIDTLVTKNEPKGFMYYANNTGILLAGAASIVTILGAAIWFRKRKSKK